MTLVKGIRTVPMPHKTVILASPLGFCAGVRHAIEIAEATLRLYPHPIYALNEIVHNRHVVESFEQRGVRFVQSLADVPTGCTVLFSAHGVPPAVRAAAAARRLKVIDATCPFVLKVHAEVIRYARDGFAIALVGHRGHDEVIGIAGEAPDCVTVIESVKEAEAFMPVEATRVAVVTQTTLSATEANRVIDVLQRRFPHIHTPAKCDICYATTNRQEAVKTLAQRVRLILVLGAQNSSNTQRLAEVARMAGATVFLLSEVDDLAAIETDAVNEIGLTAGASTPESFIAEILSHLTKRGFDRTVTLQTVDETVAFSLPTSLRQD